MVQGEAPAGRLGRGRGEWPAGWPRRVAGRLAGEGAEWSRVRRRPAGRACNQRGSNGPGWVAGRPAYPSTGLQIKT
jgi:hypothetical protein